MRSLAQDLVRHLVRRAAATATAVAVALAVMSGSTAPARASGDDLVRFLLGAGAVAILLHSATKGGASGGQVIYPQHVLPAHCRDSQRVSGRHVAVYDASCLTAAGLRTLPGQCHEVVPTGSGARSIYVAACMLRAGYVAEGAAPRIYPPHPLPRAKVLPSHCVVRYVQGGARKYGYDSTCLLRAGFRNLPRHCVLSVGSGHDRQTLHEADCLYRSGYRKH